MKAFSSDGLQNHLEALTTSLRSEVNGEPENQLLNVDADQCVDYLASKYRASPLELDFENISVDQIERMIPAEMHGLSFNVTPGKSYPRQVIVYHLPFDGSAALLGLRPSTFEMRTFEVDVSPGSLSFEVINWRDDADAIKREADEIVSFLRRNSGRANADIEAHNRQIRATAAALVASRRQELLDRLDLLHQLDVPVKQTGDVPETFSVTPTRRHVVAKPTTSDTAYRPEPALDQGTYQHILTVIHDAGVEMERHPAIYQSADEETLRDHLLMVLAPHFESASGETFNRGGKTDILIRHEKQNLFVAECVFWSGPKAYLKKLDQALSYLTWRDSKAAIVVFVRNKKLEPVLESIRHHTPKHPCWVSTTVEGADGRYVYRFHLPSDETRGIDLTVVAFHFPD